MGEANGDAVRRFDVQLSFSLYLCMKLSYTCDYMIAFGRLSSVVDCLFMCYACLLAVILDYFLLLLDFCCVGCYMVLSFRSI